MLALLANNSEYIPNLLGHHVYWKIVKNRDEVYILKFENHAILICTHNLFDGFSIKKGISDIVGNSSVGHIPINASGHGMLSYNIVCNIFS